MVTLCALLGLQYLPITFNGNTVIIQIGCCKDISECCASGVKACTTHSGHDGDSSFSSCQASPDASDFMMVISKSMLPESVPGFLSFSGTYFNADPPAFSRQDPEYEVYQPPQSLLRG